MYSRIHFVNNNDGFELAIKQSYDKSRHNPELKPLVIVPGYGMNAFIFGYHPRGFSLEEYLAEAGFEIFSINLRTQGDTKNIGGKKNYGLKEVSLVDLPVAIDFALENSVSKRKVVDIIGCSLGGTIVYVYVALKGADKLGSIVTLGSPLTWLDIHPVLKVAFSSPKLAGMLRIKGTRTLAKMFLPVMKKLPGLLSIYLHPEITDISRPDILAQTVEDPNPVLNREISEWIVHKNLMVDGQDIAANLSKVENPLLCMLSNADGIVPPATALSVLSVVSSKVKESIMCGTDNIKMAHADMYISDYAQELVFEPLVQWLLRFR